MQKSVFLYRRGDGNDGNFPRALIELKATDNPYAALAALVANDYIAGRRVRRHIVRSIEVDGETDHGIHAVVYEGPEGEQAFGAAWLTAELQPISATDLEHESETPRPLRAMLDSGALRLYRREARKP